jgi:hypothetical protein
MHWKGELFINLTGIQLKGIIFQNEAPVTVL